MVPPSRRKLGLLGRLLCRVTQYVVKVGSPVWLVLLSKWATVVRGRQPTPGEVDLHWGQVDFSSGKTNVNGQSLA